MGYDALDTAVRNNTGTGDLSYMSITDGEIVRDAYGYDHPEVFWYKDNYHLMVYSTTTAYFSHTNTITQSQINTMKAELDAVTATFSLDTGARDCKQLRFIHDWLCDRIVYQDEVEHAHDLYGALVLKRGVCEGYAQAFTYLCHLYGFNCLAVTGYTYASSTISHAWNLVYGEGAWYFVDVTWDDDESRGGRSTYFMVGSETKINGRVFATEDHMADSLYGITPATSQFKDPDEVLRNRIILAVIVGIVIGYFVVKHLRRRKHRAQYADAQYVPSYELKEGFCPQCGLALDPEDESCKSCGALVPKKPADVPKENNPSESEK